MLKPNLQLSLKFIKIVSNIIAELEYAVVKVPGLPRRHPGFESRWYQWFLFQVCLRLWSEPTIICKSIQTHWPGVKDVVKSTEIKSKVIKAI